MKVSVVLDFSLYHLTRDRKVQRFRLVNRSYFKFPQLLYVRMVPEPWSPFYLLNWVGLLKRHWLMYKSKRQQNRIYRRFGPEQLQYE